MVGIGKGTGYDIKQLVDRSTRFFWAASYGQIYPELRRLEEARLLRSREEPTGGRPRTVYELTNTGRGALDQWLRSDEGLMGEMRDEGMLKLFFSDLAGPERQRQILRQMADTYRRKLDALEKLEPMRPGPQLTLELGQGVTRWMLEWCEQTEQRLAGRGEG
jgi:DNA-binding PadR family transcriptional regulator